MTPAETAAILDRDQHACWRCGKRAVHVVYLLPAARGGTADQANLRASCAGCLRRGHR